MEQSGRVVESEHVIDITRSNDAASSGSAYGRISNDLDLSQHDDRSSSNVRASISQLSLPILNMSNSQNSSFSRRGNAHNRRHISPLNSGFWISIELALTLGQIIVSVVVLSLSRHEHPHAPLFGWIVGYAAGCVATLPLLYWRYLHRNQDSDAASSNRSGGSHSVSIQNARFRAFVEYLKMALDCFFAVWFVVGNVWVFRGHTSSSEAPNLYRLCIVFLIFSCIGYAMPFILCATICCCLPCMISVLGFREDLNQTRGAAAESINALPTYKFKLKKSKNGDSMAAGELGVVAAGTEKERVISGEDAVCCICLANYANNDELRELPCSHLFHKECVDKWLKINALCPLCKIEVGESILSSLAGATASLRRP
ncbi:hypothetical protein Ancab_002300 [Ancistrocladus abbreviatus]